MSASYRPILLGRAAEFGAYGAAKAGVKIQLRPVYQLVSTRQKRGAPATFAEGVTRAHWGDDTITVDVSHWPDAPSVLASTWLELRRRGYQMCPVVRNDSDPGLLESARAIDAECRKGFALRIRGGAGYPTAVNGERGLETLRAAGIPSGGVDLLLDLGEVGDWEHVTQASACANELVRWTQGTGPWRSVTLVAGAFPKSISDLKPGQINSLDRFDAALYKEICALDPELDFGDYGIGHPGLPPDGGYLPLPNLRYTVDHHWLVIRDSRGRPGNESFFTACERLVGSGNFAGATMSYGDQEIARCARSEGSPGRATEWLRYGFSHHAAVVCDRLTRLGEP